MKYEVGGVAIKIFVGLKPIIYSLLIGNSSKHKKAKSVNKNVVKRISNYVLLNNKFLRHSMNRIQSKNPSKGTYEINKIYLSCFYDKIHILNNEYDGLDLGY